MAGPNASRAKRGPLPSISANADTRARGRGSSSGTEAPTTKLKPYSRESWRDLRPRGRPVMRPRKGERAAFSTTRSHRPDDRHRVHKPSRNAGIDLDGFLLRHPVAGADHDLGQIATVAAHRLSQP